MQFFNDYIEYVRDNPRRYWFKRKLFGWGWTPVTRQGWAVVHKRFELFGCVVGYGCYPCFVAVSIVR